jgi:hypothetical protein
VVGFVFAEDRTSGVSHDERDVIYKPWTESREHATRHHDGSTPPSRGGWNSVRDMMGVGRAKELRRLANPKSRIGSPDKKAEDKSGSRKDPDENGCVPKVSDWTPDQSVAVPGISHHALANNSHPCYHS